MPPRDLNHAELALLEPMPHQSDFFRRRLRILVVDDEASIREIVDATLREEGHFVQTAIDGLDGLEHFRRGAWDVVVTDRAMPGLSGEQLAGEIKIASPYLPVIMLSGFTPGVSDISDRPHGVDLMVRKPFRLDALCEAVKRAAQLYSGDTDSGEEGSDGHERAAS